MQVKKSMNQFGTQSSNVMIIDTQSYSEFSKLVINNFEMYAIDTIKKLKNKSCMLKEPYDVSKSSLNNSSTLVEEKFMIGEDSLQEAISEIKKLSKMCEECIDNFPKYVNDSLGNNKLKKQIRWDISEKISQLYENDTDSRNIEKIYRYDTKEELYEYMKNMCDSRRKLILNDIQILEKCFDNSKLIGSKRERPEPAGVISSPKVENPGMQNSFCTKKEK